MQEEAIQAKLKENIPKPEFRDNEQPQPVTAPEPDGSHDNLPLDNMMLKHQMFDFLEIPMGGRTNPETVGRVEAILNWAYAQTGSREFGDLLRAINRQEGIMGSRLSNDRAGKLYRYVKLSNQMNSLEEQMRGLYG